MLEDFSDSKEVKKIPIPLPEDDNGISWGLVKAISVTIVIFIVAQLSGILLLNIYPLLRHWNQATSSDWLNNSVIAQFIYSLIVEGLSVFILWRFLLRFKSSFQSIGLKKPALKDISYIIGGFVVYFIGYLLLSYIVGRIDHNYNANQQQAVGFDSAKQGWQLVLAFLSLVLLPPFVEELLFRGFLYSGLKKAMPVVWAALLTSILFAFPHLFESSGNGLLWVAGIDTFVLSLVLVYLREKTGSLWASIGLHALKNALAFVTIFYLH